MAGTVLEEAAEAVRTVRDSGWSAITGLSSSLSYYPTFCASTNTWALLDTSTSPASGCTGKTEGIFTRTITVASVSRDGSDNITASGGSVDSGTRLVTVTVSWQERGTTMTKNLSFYIMNIFS